MKVEQAMSKEVVSCLPDDSLREAIAVLSREERSCLVVLDSEEGRRVAGIVTERDVCAALSQNGCSPDTVAVRDAMSAPVHCCRPDDALWELLGMSETYRVRRFPVIDAAGQLLGMIDLDDVAFEAAIARSGIPTLSTHEVCRVVGLCSRRRGAIAAR